MDRKKIWKNKETTVTKQEHNNQLNIAYARMIGNGATRLGYFSVADDDVSHKNGSNDDSDNNTAKTAKTREK